MKMDDEQLLSRLQSLEEDSSQFTFGALGKQREASVREYNRMPYGNEEEGLSSIVTSEVQDTIEWLLPDLLDVFVSTDKAVVFEPSRAEDVQGAEQATDAVNYVFHKQNNGFLILHTAFKDALLVKNCAVMWRKETKRSKTVTPFKEASGEMVTMLLQQAGEDAEIDSANEIAPGVFSGRISHTQERTTIKVEAFEPDTLRIQRDWTSPLLQDCPYVARMMDVTLSDLHEMGYDDVEPEDLAGSDESNPLDRLSRNKTNDESRFQLDNTSEDDESQTRGILRIEYVLVDFDGDGIAERRCIYRLKERILKNEEVSHVPIATASPILMQHRWDGMSMAEAVSDLQLLNTELTRQMVDSGRLALNPRTKVLTDANGAPYADIDDLLDNRAGGIVRMQRADAVTEMITPWVGSTMFPMLEYTQSMLSKRTGVSQQSQGLDPNALNRGGKYESLIMSAGQKRIKLIARVFAEILLKPIFQGILKTLTDGDMEKLSFRLRNEFVEFDPNEWRDSYDMTSNVGLGTGDREQQNMVLQSIAGNQAAIAQSPFGSLLITPKNVYNAQAKLVEHAGFKNVGEFWTDPGDQMPPPIEPPPDPALQIKQMELQADAQKFQAQSQQDQSIEQLKAQAKLQEVQANLELQAANDQRDSERETMKAQYQAQLDQFKLEFERYKTDSDNRTKIIVAQIAHPDGNTDPVTGSAIEKPDPMAAITEAISMLAESMNRPKTIIRGPDGKVIGAQ